MKIHRPYIPAILVLILCGCTQSPPEDAKLKVVSSTTIVGDVVSSVGGSHIDHRILLRPGQDPHGYILKPAELAALSDAKIIFLNGFNLEGGLEKTLLAVSTNLVRSELCRDVKPRILSHKHGDHSHEGIDPHAWTDPICVLKWVDEIELVLSSNDPANANAYHANATVLKGELRDLDAWIESRLSAIPPESRILICDHDVMGYFCDRYSFESGVSMIDGFSTLSQPSAQHVAGIQNRLTELEIPVMFISEGISMPLMTSIARDAGIRVVKLYTGSLGSAEHGADSYVGMMRFNVDVIAASLVKRSVGVAP